MLELIKDPEQWTWRPNSLLRRIVICFVGVVIVSTGSAICLHGNTGVDPFTALQQSVSEVSGLSLAIVSPVINAAILLFIIPFDRKIFGLGTIINASLFGLFVTLVRDALSSVYQASSAPVPVLIHLVLGMILFCLGISLYISTDIGQSAADGIAPVLVRSFPIHIQG